MTQKNEVYYTKEIREWLNKAASVAGSDLTYRLDNIEINLQHPDTLRRVTNESIRSQPLLLLLSGSSESGKSHFGTKFANEGTGSRIKIVRIIREGQEKGDLKSTYNSCNEISPLALLNDSSANRPEIVSYVTSRMSEILSENRTPIAVVETLKHPWLVSNLLNSLTLRALSLFITAPLETRARREAEKTGTPYNELMQLIPLKDAEKSEYGNDDIEKLATLSIVNGGLLPTYDGFISAMMAFTRLNVSPFIGTPIEYK